MKLIGLHGKARSGKDTIGKYIEKTHNYSRYAFANPLKKAVQKMFSLSDDEVKEENKENIIERWGMSFRKMLQLVGTEVARSLRDDIWIKNAEFKYLHLKWVEKNIGKDLIKGMIITDVRFENEAKWIRENGGQVWFVERDCVPENVGVTNHKSESGIEKQEGDITITNNSTFELLYQKINKNLK